MPLCCCLSAGVKVQHSQQPTNGVTYVRMLAGLPELSEDLLPLVPLFCGVITRYGEDLHMKVSHMLAVLWSNQKSYLFV